MSQRLLCPQVALRGLDRGMAEEQLDLTPENDSNEILTQVIGLTCSGQTGRIHRADFDFWGLAEER